MYIIMKLHLKTLLVALFLFLMPLTFQIGIPNHYEVGINSGEAFSLIKITSNTTYAIDLGCGPTEFSCGVQEGILDVWEILWFYTTQIGVALVGYVLDIFTFMSINSQFYRSGFIETGWEILRDFTNVVFIFSFLYMAFRMVLDIDAAHTKKQLIKTILVALTVNFSLFIAYATIDASNILAH